MTFLLPLLVIGLLSAAFMTVSRPYADDWCVMRFADTVGMNNAYIQYHTWSGRFASNESTAIVHGFAPLLIPLSFAAWYIALVLLLRRYTRLTLPVCHAGAAAVLLCMIAIAPDMYQSYLWTTGLLTYSAPLILFTWALVVLAWSPALCALIVFLAVGYSDVGGVFIVLFFAALSLTQRRAWLPLVAAAIGVGLVVIAPGNAVRQAYFPPPSLEGILLALSQTGVFLLHNFGALVVLSVVFAIIGLNRGHGIKRTIPLSLPLLVIVGSALLAEAVSGYALSGGLIARAWIVPQYVSVLGAAVWGYGVGLRLRGARGSGVRWRWLITPLMPLIIGAGVNLLGTYQDMRAYVTVYGSGTLLETQEAWVVECAREYYPQAHRDQSGEVGS